MKKIRLLFKMWGILILAGMLSPTVVLAIPSSEVDVTSTYITNAGFDASCNYLFDAAASNLGSANGGVNIQAVSGWTIGTTGDNSAASSFEYGYAGTLNSPGNIPATDPDGASGTGEGTLGVSVAWEGSVTYFQTATLPAGTYKLKYKAYNTGAVTYDKSLVGWVPDVGTASLSTIVDFPLITWTSDVVNFTVTAETAGKLQIGLEAKAAGSGGNGRIFFDDLQLLYTAAILSDDATLSNLTTTVGELSPAFDITTTDYILLVPSSTQSLVLVSTVTDAGASAVGDGEITLTDGIGAASIVVTAENGDTKTYNVSIDANDCYTPHYSDRKNLIADPTFSASSLAAGGFSGWGPTGIIAKGAYCGKGSAHIRGNCWPDGGSLDRKLTTANGNALKPNTTYQLRAMVNSKAAAGTSFQFQVEGYDGTESIFYQLENTNGWMQFDKKFTTGATITEMGIYFNSCTNKPLITDSCFLDNYELFVAPMKVSTSELTFTGGSDKDITVTGQELTEEIVITASAGFSVSPAALASDVVDGAVTVTYDGVASASGYVYLTTGTMKDSIAVSGTAEPTISTDVSYLLFDELAPTASFKVSGGNLTSDIMITAPTGFSVDVSSLLKDASDVVVTVTYDASAVINDTIVLTSDAIVAKLAVVGRLNTQCFTPLYTDRSNLITDQYLTDLSNFGGWGDKSIVKDTVSYCGATSGLISGGSIDAAVGLLESNTTYKVKAMVKAASATAQIGVYNWGDGNSGDINHLATVVGEWAPIEFTFTTLANPTGGLFFNNSPGSYVDNWELYKLSNDSTLSTLTVSVGDLTPAFDSAVSTYTVIVPLETTSVTVTGTANDAHSVVSGDGAIALTDGVGSAEVVVTAESGDTKTYTVNFTVLSKKELIFVQTEKSQYDSVVIASIVGYADSSLYNVTVITKNVITADLVSKFDSADVVIMGRSISSGDVGTGKAVWDSISAPVLSMNMYGLRGLGDKAAWTPNITSINVVSAPDTVLTADILVGSDPVFAGVTTESMDWWNGMFSIFGADDEFTSAGNGQLLAKTIDNRPLFIRWAANVEFYEGAGHSPNGDRSYIGCGNDNTTTNYFGFSDAAKEVFFAELARLASGEPTVIPAALSKDATLATLVPSAGTIAPVFDAATNTYVVTLPAGTTDVPTLSATATDAKASVKITDATSLTESATVAVTAEYTYVVKTYTVTYQISEGVNTQEATSVAVTPTVSAAGFKVAASAGSVINVYDITGQLITSVVAVSNTTSVDIPQAGIYMVKVGSSVTKVIKID